MEKKLFKVWWLDTPDANGDRAHQYTTKRDTDMISAIKAVVDFFELEMNDIIKAEQI